MNRIGRAALVLLGTVIPFVVGCAAELAYAPYAHGDGGLFLFLGFVLAIICGGLIMVATE